MTIRFLEVWGSHTPKDRKYCCILIKNGEIVASGFNRLRSKALNEAKAEYRFFLLFSKYAFFVLLPNHS